MTELKLRLTRRDAVTPTMVRLERVGAEADGVPWWL
jgi:hypothetical protein